MADIGDIDHVGEPVALEAERPAQHVGKDIGPHVADVRIVVDRRPAGIDPRLALVNGPERLQLAGQAVEQAKGGVSHGRGLNPAGTGVKTRARGTDATRDRGSYPSRWCRR